MSKECQRNKEYSKIMLTKRGLLIDNTVFRNNPVVSAIASIGDSLRDLLKGYGDFSQYASIKKEIDSPDIIHGDLWEQVKQAENIVSDEPPKTLFKRELMALENKMFGRYELTDESRLDLIKDQELYIQNLQPLAKYFKNPLDFREYAMARARIYQILQTQGIDLNRFHMLNNSREKDFVKTIMNAIETNETIAITKYLGGSHVENLAQAKEKILNDIIQAMPEEIATRHTEGQVKDLIDDMFNSTDDLSPILKKLDNTVNEIRGVVMPLKYTVGVTSGTKLLIQNALLGSVSLYSRSKGLNSILESDLIKMMQNDYNILKSENKLEPNVEFGVTMIDRMFQMLGGKLNDPRLITSLQAVQRVAAGGIHNIWDIAIDSTAKKTFIAEALAEIGIDGYNIKAFEDKLRNGQIPFTILEDIRTRAHEKYSYWFTQSSSASRTKSRFSSKIWLPFNFMQGYTLKKTAQIQAAFVNLVTAFRLGKIKSVGDVGRYLNTKEGSELRNIILNLLVAGKIGVYVDSKLSAQENMTAEERKKYGIEYAIALNDYLSSATSNFMANIIGSGLRMGSTEYYYIDENGQTQKSTGGIPGFTFGVLDQTVRTAFREFQVFNFIPHMLKGADSNIDMGLALRSAEEEFNRVLNGLGRYSLDSGLETFNQVPYPELRDQFHSALMIKNELNQSMVLRQKIFDKDTLTQVMHNPGSYIFNANFIKKFVPFGLMYNFGNGADGLNKNSVFHKVNDLIEENKAINDIYNGIYNPELVTDQNISSLYKELTSFQNVKFGENTDIIEINSDFGVHKDNHVLMKLRLKDQLGEELYKELLNSIQKKERWRKDANGKSEKYIPQIEAKDKQRKLAELMAEAEEKVPGSFRILTSIAANEDFFNAMKERYNVTNQNNLTDGQRMELQKEIFNKYAQQLMDSDNYTRYNFLMEMVNREIPVLQKDSELKTMVGSAAFQQLIMHNEVKKGKPDARYLSSIISFAGKFVPDELRLPLIKDAFFEVDQLDIPIGHKQILQTGIALGNLNFMDTVARDEEFRAKYGDRIDDVLNLIYNTQTQNAMLPNEDMIDKSENGYSKKYGPRRRKSWKKFPKNFNRNYPHNQYPHNQYPRNGYPKGEKSDPEDQDDIPYNNEVARKKLSEGIANLPYPKKRSTQVRMDDIPSATGYKRPKPSPFQELMFDVQRQRLGKAITKDLDKTENFETMTPSKIHKKFRDKYRARKWNEVPLVLPKAKKPKGMKLIKK